MRATLRKRAECAARKLPIPFKSFSPRCTPRRFRMLTVSLLASFQAAPGCRRTRPVSRPRANPRPVHAGLALRGPGGAVPVALEKGYFKAEGLDVTIDTGNGSREAIPRVASGTYQMGFGDMNSLVRFRDENPTSDVKAVLMVYDRPPVRHHRAQEPRHLGRSQEPARQEVRRAGRGCRLRPVADLQGRQQARRQGHEVRERRLSRPRADARPRARSTPYSASRCRPTSTSRAAASRTRTSS